MQLTRFSDLALRLMLYLAASDRPLETMVTVRAAADLFNVPYTHLVKVVHQLSRQGLVTTTKGKGGGLRLSRSPALIRVGDVVRITEPQDGVIDCWTQPCPLRNDCTLKRVLDGAFAAFFRELDQYTLAEVAEMPLLKQLVQISLTPSV